ncbi:pyridoxamine 5'-phosphate oxidase family protein [Luteimonas sp. Y-2-2-4F]|nr:pyridoxamine 5'-phosphate oxidase family protein [Luteimonas sp. Y-2-2-4F]MCD9030129.1 pyridoxamine 5'-phosphate oxidase family protein [Luteimonas sp. Y-2-2-4F]
MTGPDRSELVERLAELIDDVEIAMLTTRTADGRLVSRPLRTQRVEPDGSLWFATSADSGKVAEIGQDPRVCLAYESPSKNTYVSVSGRASVVDDRARIEALWSAPMRIFFPEGKDDPRLRLIRVEPETVEYWDSPGSVLGKVLYLATAAATGNPDALSEHERVDLR